MRQIETSRTLVFDAPRHARGFFEALVVDNLDIGRPDSVELIFHGPRRTGRPPKLDCVGQDEGRHPRHRGHRQRVLQTLPDQAVLERRAGVADRNCRQLARRPALSPPPRAPRRPTRPEPVTSTAACSILNVSARVVSLRVQPLSGSRIAQPTLTEDGRRAPALRFGDPRVQALAGALCTTVLAVTGITNKSLRALMTGLLGGANYSINQASYDLARLRVNALITRIPGRNRYRLTRRRPRVRDLLHQGPRPPAAPPACRRPAARSAADTKRLAHHRYSHHKMHRQRQTVTSSSLKTQDNSQCPSDKGSLADCCLLTTTTLSKRVVCLSGAVARSRGSTVRQAAGSQVPDSGHN